MFRLLQKPADAADAASTALCASVAYPSYGATRSEARVTPTLPRIPMDAFDIICTFLPIKVLGKLAQVSKEINEKLKRSKVNKVDDVSNLTGTYAMLFPKLQENYLMKKRDNLRANLGHEYRLYRYGEENTYNNNKSKLSADSVVHGFYLLVCGSSFVCTGLIASTVPLAIVGGVCGGLGVLSCTCGACAYCVEQNQENKKRMRWDIKLNEFSEVERRLESLTQAASPLMMKR